MILLVVLAILSLFLLISLTYVMVSTQSMRNARLASRAEERGDSPEALLNMASQQVFSGTRNPLSVLGPHSLLEDLYGNDEWMGMVSMLPAYPVSVGAGGQLVQLSIDPFGPDGVAGSAGDDDSANGADDLGEVNWPGSDDPGLGADGMPGVAGVDDDGNGTVDDITEVGWIGSDDRPMSKFNGFYAGRLMTMLDGPCAGQSTRIVKHTYDGTTGVATLWVMAFESSLIPNQGNRLLINGRPFNGTGFGLNIVSLAAFNVPPTGGSGNVILDESFNVPLTTAPPPPPFQFDYGLLPNPALPHPVRELITGTFQMSLSAGGAHQEIMSLGGADESWDAVDYQNMLLAMRRSLGAGLSPVVEIPSLHRPELVNYWYQRLYTYLNDPSVTPSAVNTGLPPAQLPLPALPPDPVRDAILFPLGADGKPGVAGVDDDSNGTIDDLSEVGASGSDDCVLLPEIFQLIGAVKRSVVLRPLADDHPRFTGSNPGFDPFTTAILNPGVTLPWSPPWDVDNDGDGVPDSIWVDLGLPVQTGADGRKYKPLFAILCLDMDGKLNINAHGTIAQTLDALGGASFSGPFAGGSTTLTSTGGHGQGYGPAEINLMAVLSNPVEYRRLLCGWTRSFQFSGGTYLTTVIEGRYGEASRAIAGTLELDPSVGTTAGPGVISTTDDILDRIRHFDLPDDYRTSVRDLLGGNLGSYASPMDIDGDGLLSLDLRGQPMYLAKDNSAVTGFGELGERLNDPYQLNLSLKAPHAGVDMGSFETSTSDSPFHPGELEFLLRFYDVDQPAGPTPDNRIAYLAPTTALNPQLRNLVTTDSWDLPVPSMTPPADMVSPTTGGGTDGIYISRLALPGNTHITDLYLTRLLQNGFFSAFASFNDPGAVDAANLAIDSLVPQDLLAGLRMDINRPFGDGQDNNNNGVRDEPQEADPTLALGDRDTVNDPVTGTQYPFDQNRSGALDVNGSDMLARQHMAKDLYVLMMVLMDRRFETDLDGNNANNQIELARMIAQWAVNVVDYRDADSIMTPFEYDITPFTDEDGDGDPWDVDGWVGVTPDPSTGSFVNSSGNPIGVASSDDGQPYRGLVWGCERPELLITETIATHDRRSEDTTADSSNNKVMDGDPDFDQTKRPFGSLFVELYNPWSSPRAVEHNGTDFTSLGTFEEQPAELYDNPLPQYGGVDLSTNPPRFGGVDLARRAGGSGVSPVWRLVVSKSNSTLPATYDQNDPVLTGNVIERTFYFTDPTPADAAPIGLNSDATSMRMWSTGRAVGTPAPAAGNPSAVLPGRYAVIGSENITFAVPIPGETAPNGGTYLGKKLPTGAYPRRIRLTPGSSITSLGLYDSASALLAPYSEVYDSSSPTGAMYSMQPVTAVMIDRPQPVNADDLEMRFSVSEPTDGYPAVTPHYIGGYGSSPTQPVKDSPLDLSDVDLWQNGTVVAYKTIYLQRLANPLLEWNPLAGQPGHDNTRPVNPYITIDQMPVDLTVYNSEDTDMAAMEPAVPTASGSPPQGAKFNSRQRGSIFPGDIWYAVTTAPTDTPNVLDFAPTLVQPTLDRTTLGYLNTALGDRYSGPSGSPPTGTQLVPTGATGIPNNSPTYLANEYIGAPVNLPPWLNWGNRPYISATELMQVGWASPATLLSVHSQGPSSAMNPYQSTGIDSGPTPPPVNPDTYTFLNWLFQPPNPPTVPAANPPMAPTDPFLHLLNFFLSSSGSWKPTASADNAAPEFHRILDYVRVPSRFAGTAKYLNPTEFQAGLATPVDPLTAPFNHVSEYREPGRVNINTIFDQRVWQGVVDDPTGAGLGSNTMWANVWNSRRGYDVPLSAVTLAPIGNDFNQVTPSPTIFAQPFRSYDANYLVPIDPLRQVNMTGGVYHNEVDGGLLRPLNPSAGTFVPLFVPSIHPAAILAPGAPTGGQSSYFDYRLLQKLDNLVTTRSNVYAVWITMGYFEVERVSITPGNPDGWRLGEEVGSDTGNIERHRAFYIFDRSIPMGFLRGEKLNTERGVLLRRFIE